MSSVVCDVDDKTEKSVNEIFPSPRGPAQASVKQMSVGIRKTHTVTQQEWK